MLEQTFIHQKAYSLNLRKDNLELRLDHLDALELMITKNQKALCEALYQDFKKPEAEALMTEIYPLIHEIAFVKKNLEDWIKPEKVGTPLLLIGTENFIKYEPRGACLLISPWNYPVYLTLGPLISAIAAGNTVIIKPSEISANTSRLLHKIIAETFKSEHIVVVEGGAETTQELLNQPFDHIFFTGSTQVGKIIMAGAAKHLASVTLELGGKSPTLVDSTADLNLAAEKILWGKFINAGQTCIAPDYLFVQESVYEQFVQLLKEKLALRYGKTPEDRKNSDSFARIISTKHTLRLKGLLEDALSNSAQFLFGGSADVETKYIEPTLVTELPPQSLLMQEEIFGPILPILKFKEITEVVHFINDRPKPLALYMFSRSQNNIDIITQETSSGALSINDTVIHMANPYLPFGGVGESGVGGSHGHHGFKAFSHGKAVFKQCWTGRFLSIVYPPYNKNKVALIKQLIRFKI